MRSATGSNVRHRPRIGITMGDPAGIGAEIIVKALTNHEIYELCRPLVIGDTARLRQVAGILRLPIKIKIGVCGINPHAGENGLFGSGEEEQKIFPAVQNCQKRGVNVAGPFPADTLFFRAGRGDFDLVVAMYHDQGHGPIKVLGLDEGVNITLGLPIVRTSVDHGTAFDISGSGKADERSLLAAIRYAVELAPRRS